MKKIEAIIKPFRLEEVRDALCALGIEGMTVIEVKGLGHQRRATGVFPGDEYGDEFIPKIKLEVVVSDKVADQVVMTIMKSAQTGKFGDGKVFVSKIDKAIRIRTQGEGEEAI